MQTAYVGELVPVGEGLTYWPTKRRIVVLDGSRSFLGSGSCCRTLPSSSGLDVSCRTTWNFQPWDWRIASACDSVYCPPSTLGTSLRLPFEMRSRTSVPWLTVVPGAGTTSTTVSAGACDSTASVLTVRPIDCSC